YVFVIICFFFQAEDGIRDFHVTGVQTCALPISVLKKYLLESAILILAAFEVVRRIQIQQRERLDGTVHIHGVSLNRLVRNLAGRSEERRVGKECRSRWAAEQ